MAGYTGKGYSQNKANNICWETTYVNNQPVGMKQVPCSALAGEMSVIGNALNLMPLPVQHTSPYLPGSGIKTPAMQTVNPAQNTPSFNETSNAVHALSNGMPPGLGAQVMLANSPLQPPGQTWLEGDSFIPGVSNGAALGIGAGAGILLWLLLK